MKNKFNILTIEDNPQDTILLRRTLESAQHSRYSFYFYKLHEERSLAAGLERLSQGNIDVVLLDLQLPDSRGLDSFLRVHAQYSTIPIIIISVQDDEELAVEAVRNGAQDYLVKDQLSGNLLIRTIRHAIERQGAEIAVRRSEEKFRSLAEQSPNMIFISIRDKIVYANEKSIEVLGYTFEELSSDEFGLTSLIAPEALNMSREAILKMIAGQTIEPSEFVLVAQDDHRIEVIFTANSIVYEDGLAFLSTIIDVTGMKALEREVIKASEREQIRIGQNLHDDLGQHLAGIRYMCDVIKDKLQKQKAAEADEMLEILELLDKAIMHTKSLSKELFPVNIHLGDLSEAFKKFTNGIEKIYNVQCQIIDDHSVRVEDQSEATQLYRIMQEAVNNALRHGAADRIIITLQSDSHWSRLLIDDNGKGLPNKIDTSVGMGFHNMRYRARMIGAELKIESNGGQGTRVACSWPIGNN